MGREGLVVLSHPARGSLARGKASGLASHDDEATDGLTGKNPLDHDGQIGELPHLREAPQVADLPVPRNQRDRTLVPGAAALHLVDGVVRTCSA